MVYWFMLLFVFFFKQKPAYDVRISDWSADVCSSDLSFGQRGGQRTAHRVEDQRVGERMQHATAERAEAGEGFQRVAGNGQHDRAAGAQGEPGLLHEIDRKSVVEGKGVAGRLVVGGRRIIKTKHKHKNYRNSDN